MALHNLFRVWTRAVCINNIRTLWKRVKKGTGHDYPGRHIKTLLTVKEAGESKLECYTLWKADSCIGQCSKILLL